MELTLASAPGDGLEGVIAAETRLSEVDGLRGRLIVAGHSVEELAADYDFEAACALLWMGRLPSAAEHDRVRQLLAEARADAFRLLPDLGGALRAADAMDALRAAIAHLAPLPADTDEVAQAAHVTGAVAVFAANWARLASGKQPVEPSAGGHADDYLRMLRGHDPGPLETRALGRYLVTVADHGMSASTFAARVVASTGSDIVSAVTAAIGALKGPLHGGAPGPVLDMLDAIGEPAAANTWLRAEISAGRRIMGMGHRVYRVRDPRAAVLESALRELETGAAGGRVAARLTLAREVEKCAEALLAERHPTRLLKANVEFYTAVLLEACGLPRTMFSATFAAARVAGWTAHYFEQRRVGRLIRPIAQYVGPRT